MRRGDRPERTVQDQPSRLPARRIRNGLQQERVISVTEQLVRERKLDILNTGSLNDDECSIFDISDSGMGDYDLNSSLGGHGATYSRQALQTSGIVLPTDYKSLFTTIPMQKPANMISSADADDEIDTPADELSSSPPSISSYIQGMGNFRSETDQDIVRMYLSNIYSLENGERVWQSLRKKSKDALNQDAWLFETKDASSLL